MAQFNMLSDNSFLSVKFDNNDQNALKDMIQKKMLSTSTNKKTNFQNALNKV